VDRDTLCAWIRDAREKTLLYLEGLDEEQLIGPRLEIVNPPLWEVGHVGWFQERWMLRHAAGEPARLPHGDALYDSIQIAHRARPDLGLLPRAEIGRQLRELGARVVERVQSPAFGPDDEYFALLTLFHEDMHVEAFTYTCQTLAYRAPPYCARYEPGAGAPLPGDADVPGGAFRLGAPRGEPFVFDNEKWEHEVQLEPFCIARAPVTQREFAQFVRDGGYRRRALWSADGWRWRKGARAELPVYWRADGPRDFVRRVFDRWLPLAPDEPMIHVNYFEAQAYCRFAARRLPTEAEWEAAASGAPPAPGPGPAAHKRRLPWGDRPPDAARACLDFAGGGCAPVSAAAAGDSAFGCRQMIGGVWEWTASDFLPFPGFVADPYREYSEPWFATRKVLRGGCWATRARLLRNTWRNFFEPHRNDIFAGFRTCALRA